MIVFLVVFASMTYSVRGNVRSDSRPGNESLQIIGIFSYCNSNSSSKILMPNDVFYQKASICKNSIDWVVNNRDDVSNGTLAYHWEFIKSKKFQTKHNYIARWDLNDIEFIPYYVCTKEDAMRLSTDILLNQKFYVSNHYQKYPKWRSIFIPHWSRTTKVLAVLLYTDNFITEQLVHLLSISSFPIYHMDSNWKLPDRYVITRKKVFDSPVYYYFQVDKMENIFARKRVKKFTIILIGLPNYLYQYFMKRIRLTKKYCYVSLEITEISETTLRSFVTKLLDHNSNNTLKFLILFGKAEDQISLYNHAIANGINETTWFLQNIELHYNRLLFIPETTRVLTLFNAKSLDLIYLEYLQPIKNLEAYVRNKLPSRQLVISNAAFSEISIFCSRYMKRMYMGYMESLEPGIIHMFQETFRMYLLNFKVFIQKVNSQKSTNLIKAYANGRYFIAGSWIFYLEKHNYPACHVPICSKGLSMEYGTVPHTKKWNDSTGWFCKKCPSDAYKDFVGDGRCIPCPNLMVPTLRQDSCFDPYTLNFNGVQQRIVKVCIAFSTSSAFLSVFILSTFVYYRKTPLIRTSDLKTVFLHLILLLLTFVMFPVVFFSRPSLPVCTLRPFMVTVLCSSSVSIMLIKTNRILSIINAKLRISREEMKKRSFFNVSLVALFNAIGVSIAYVAMHNHSPSIKIVLNHQLLIRDVTCSNNFHVNLQIFATFTTTMVYISTIPIYFFLTIESDRPTLQCFIIVSTNIVHLILLYGKRTFMIYFQPGKNTRNYIQSQMHKNTVLDEINSR